MESAVILAIVQARVSSTRLPAKALSPILGKPMLARQLERIRRARKIDRLLVATSVDSTDDPLAELCRQEGVECHRGSLEDVLDRFYQAARAYRPDIVIRLTGDCPLTDPQVIDQCADLLDSSGCDYASNAIEPTYPDGLDVEALRYDALETAWKKARLPSEREHVTQFIVRHPELFRIGHLRGDVDRSALRWTVDEPEDLELVRRIYGALYPSNPAFTTADILALLERHPELKTFNVHHRRNEGLEKTLKKDKEWLKQNAKSKK